MQNLRSIHLTDQLLESLFDPSDSDNFEYLDILKECERVMSKDEWIELNDIVMERIETQPDSRFF